MKAMNEATLKVSRAMQPLAHSLDDTVKGICGKSVPWLLLAFTEGRTSYVSNSPTRAQEISIIAQVRRWHDYMTRGEHPPVLEGEPDPDESSLQLAHALRDLAKAISEVVDDIAGEHIHIAFVAFPQGAAQYASNAERPGVLGGIGEWLDYVDAADGEHIRAHEVT